VLPKTRSPLQAVWKEEHETSPINPGNREISASRRLRGRLGNLLASGKCPNAHTCAKPAANDMHSRRDLIVITERGTIPVRVFIVVSNGVASTEATSGSSILVLGKAAGSRRKATIIGREQPPAIKHDQRVHPLSLRPPPTLPAPAAAKATHVPSTFSSTGKDAQPVNDVVDYTSRLPPVLPGAPDRSSRAATALIPTLPVSYGVIHPIRSLLPAMMRSGPTPLAPGLDPIETLMIDPRRR
jgi:hypothetical protein